MSQGPRAVYPVTLASGVTSSSAIDLTRSWKTVWIEIGSMASGDLFIKGAATIDGNYRRLTTTLPTLDFKVGSAATQKIIALPVAAGGVQYMKVENSSGCTDVVTTYNLICSD